MHIPEISAWLKKKKTFYSKIFFKKGQIHIQTLLLVIMLITHNKRHTAQNSIHIPEISAWLKKKKTFYSKIFFKKGQIHIQALLFCIIMLIIHNKRHTAQNAMNIPEIFARINWRKKRKFSYYHELYCLEEISRYSKYQQLKAVETKASFATERD